VNKNKLKVYVVGPSTGYARFIQDYVLVNNMASADIILFTGGADVNPKLYGEEAHPTTYFNMERDLFEIQEYKKSLEVPNVLRVGICRGNQLLGMLNGCKLVQDVTHHAIGKTHKVIVYGEEPTIFDTTSLHHQMVYPYNINKDEYDILAGSYPKLSAHYYGGGISWKDYYKEVEVIYFPKTNSLGIQGHPEMMDNYSPFVKYLNSIILSKLNKNG